MFVMMSLTSGNLQSKSSQVFWNAPFCCWGGDDFMKQLKLTTAGRLGDLQVSTTLPAVTPAAKHDKHFTDGCSSSP